MRYEEVHALLKTLAPIVAEYVSKQLEEATQKIEILEARLDSLSMRVGTVEERPAPEQGEKGDRGDAGEQGPPGFSLRDFDTEMQADGKTVLLKWISGDIEETHELEFKVRDGVDGKDGKNGEPGKDGRDGINGKDGEPGEQGLAGRDGIDGASGRDGVDGKDGSPGNDGKDAPPITREQLAEVLAGDDSPLHRVVREYMLEHPPEPGRDGQPGVPGRDGKDGASGSHGKDGAPGVDGLDGIGFDDLEFEYDGERTLTLVFVRGDLRKEFSFKIPAPMDRGPFKEGSSYETGDLVSFGGSMFIAQRDTTTKPETSADWRLCVKRGRDGRDGKDGKQGERGLAGKDGKWQSGS